MLSIQPCPIPHGALLNSYLIAGSYTDCYATDIPTSISHPKYITAFYTTPVFKLERLILQWALSKPSTDDQAAQLAAGTIDGFAAWHVEKRAENQLLLSDFRGRTKSWLMTAPLRIDGREGTRLYFGSAVVPVVNPSTGEPRLGFAFRALLGFHKVYSRVLLFSARSKLKRNISKIDSRTKE